MKKRKKFIPHLLIAILSLAGFFLFINIFDPKNLFDVFFFKLPAIIIFFFLVFLVFGGLYIYIFANFRRGILSGILVVSFLTLQYLHYNNIVYTIILIAIILLIELMFWKKT